MTALIPAVAFLVLLLALTPRPLRGSSTTQREAAQVARLDTYTPQTTDRFGEDWYSHHGRGG